MSSTQTWQFFIHILVGWIFLATISQYKKEGWYHSWRPRRQVLLSVKPALFLLVLQMVWIQQDVSRDFASHFPTLCGNVRMETQPCRNTNAEHGNNTHPRTHTNKHKHALKEMCQHDLIKLNQEPSVGELWLILCQIQKAVYVTYSISSSTATDLYSLLWCYAYPPPLSHLWIWK